MQLDKRIEEIRNFINTYAEDYLTDGTKARIIAALEKNNQTLALDLISAMDEEWVKKVKETGSFRLFDNPIPVSITQQNSFKPYFKATYMDEAYSNKSNIPVLKHISARQCKLR